MSSGNLQTKFSQERIIAESRKSLVIKQAEDSGSLTTTNGGVVHIELPRQGWCNFSESYIASNMSITASNIADTNNTKPGSMSVFKSMVVKIGGVPMETISEVHILSRILNETSMDSDSSTSGMWALGYNRTQTLDGTASIGIADNALQVAQGGSRVCYKTPSGILNYNGLYPLHLSSPVVIELTLNSTLETILVGTVGTDLVTISNVAYHASVYDVPREFNDFAVAQSRTPEGYNFFVPSWHSTSHNTVAATSQTFNVTNNARSAKTVLFCQRALLNLNDGDADYFFTRDTLDTIQAEIGTSVYPNAPLKTGADAYIEMQKARGNDISQALTRGRISKLSYHATGGKAIYGFNLEKFVSDTEVTGTDLANNPLKISWVNTSAATLANKVYFFTEREGKMSIRAGGDVEYRV